MTGILLIHGGWHGPWCWDDFGERLTVHGHEVRAVQLRGHDQRAGRIWYRAHHYLDDVRRAAAEFARPPVLIGHSLGGLLAQKYAERHPVRALVLMASVPTTGMIRPVGRLAARHPLAFLKTNLQLSLGPFIRTPELTRDLFFTSDTPQPIVDHCHTRLQNESYLMLVDVVTFVRPRPGRVDLPVLVLGAERDAFFTLDEVRSTARAYGTEAEILAGAGHDMMLEQGWRELADRVDSWVRGTPSPD